MEEKPQAHVLTPQREWTRVIVLVPAPPPPTQPAPASPADPAYAGFAVTPAPDAANPPAGLSEALRAEFEKRDWFAVVEHDPHLALAELALREKAQSARAAWGLQRMEGLALVIVEPKRWADETVADLCAAIRRWLPAATIWSASGDRIDAINNPPCSKVKSNSRTASHNSSTSNARPTSPRVFDLDALVAALPRGPVSTNGFADAASAPSSSSPASPPAAPIPAPNVAEPGRLSRDEIDMLLHMNMQDEPDASPPQQEPRP